MNRKTVRATPNSKQGLTFPQIKPRMSEFFFSVLLQAALPLGGRLRRRLGRAEGPSTFAEANPVRVVGFDKSDSKAHVGRPLDGQPTPL